MALITEDLPALSTLAWRPAGIAFIVLPVLTRSLASPDLLHPDALNAQL